MAKRIKPTVAKTKRFNLELPLPAYERIKEIEDITEASSVSEVLRRSLKLYDFVIREQRRGGQIIVRNDGEDSELVILD